MVPLKNYNPKRQNLNKIHENLPQKFRFKIRRHLFPKMSSYEKCIGIEIKKSYIFSIGSHYFDKWQWTIPLIEV